MLFITEGYIYIYFIIYIYIYIYIHVIMQTMCPSGYHHNGFVASHALGHMMYDVHDVHDAHDLHIFLFSSGFCEI